MVTAPGAGVIVVGVVEALLVATADDTAPAVFLLLAAGLARGLDAPDALDEVDAFDSVAVYVDNEQ